MGHRDSPDTRKMHAAINGSYNPGKVLLFKDPAEAEALGKIAPFTKQLKMVDGKATAYICRNFACERPVNAPGKLKARLEPRHLPKSLGRK